jgi:hypothetical protein
LFVCLALFWCLWTTPGLAFDSRGEAVQEVAEFVGAALGLRRFEFPLGGDFAFFC